MTSQLEITPIGPIHGTIQPPGSKSITNRALVCAALADGVSTLSGALWSDDTLLMIACLRRLGFQIVEDWANQLLRVEGAAGQIPSSSADLFVGNSGTTVRFLTAMVSIGNGRYRLDGVDRMRARPIQDLLDALQELGVEAVSERGTGAPPVIVNTRGLVGGSSTVTGSISSQYLSGLLMATPCAQHDVTLQVHGELVSRPYVDMTLAVMREFGAEVDVIDESYRVRSGQSYHACRFVIEPDASAASYFWAAAAITGGAVKVTGLSRSSLQGDVGFCECLARMGCDVSYEEDGIKVTGKRLTGIDVDMNAISDTVQTLAAVALFAEGETTIRGVAHNRHKETDRIGNLAVELRKLGAEVVEADDGLRIIPRPLRSAVISTYDDHRMAMSLALVGLKIPSVVIENPECTTKTYPKFFEDLAKLAAT